MSSSLVSLNEPLKNNSYKMNTMDKIINELASVENGANIFKFLIKQNIIIGNRMKHINI